MAVNVDAAATITGREGPEMRVDALKMVQRLCLLWPGRHKKRQGIWCWNGAEEVGGMRGSGSSSSLDIEVILVNLGNGGDGDGDGGGGGGSCGGGE